MERKEKKYKCVFCKKNVNLNELCKVDDILEAQDQEISNFIYDRLNNIVPDLKNINYIHIRAGCYRSRNLCMKCCKKASEFYENLPQAYSCISCYKEVGLTELLQVDSNFKKMNPEDARYVCDELGEPNPDSRKVLEYSHITNLDYRVLNICLDCYQKALKKPLNT